VKIQKVDEAFAKRFTRQDTSVEGAQSQIYSYVNKKKYLYMSKAYNKYEREFNYRHSTLGLKPIQMKATRSASQLEPLHAI